MVEIVAETGIPTVAHNHDFYWERKRFSVNCVWDYLNTAFSPRHPFVRQVVINTEARSQLAFRKGAAAIIIPNVMNYDKPPKEPDDYSSDVREVLGIDKKEYLILQPTRVVKRKGIEHSVELMLRLNRKGVKAKLVISHASGDEGNDYEMRLREYSKIMRVNTLFVSDLISDERFRTKKGKLEAIYFKNPILINNYSIYRHDIRPKGFKVVEMYDYITEETVSDVIDILQNKYRRNRMVDFNYSLAKRYYSYPNLKRKLRFIFNDFFGEE
ncbi:MAG: hypothetical protein J7K32_04925 [Deltaproteobacteria bacterium]|nr:hypothetical protein [Deltaproteobacteria bacterium]